MMKEKKVKKTDESNIEKCKCDYLPKILFGINKKEIEEKLFEAKIKRAINMYFNYLNLKI